MSKALTKHTARQVLDKCKDDEPIFILRAQDMGAPMIIVEWANRMHSMGAPEAKIEQAIEVASAMRDWGLKNRTKVPD